VGIKLNEYGIEFSLQSPQRKNSEIRISLEGGPDRELLCKYLVGSAGKWSTLSDFAAGREVVWTPKEPGNYTVMAQIKEKGSAKSFDYVSKAEFAIEELPAEEEKITGNGKASIEDVLIDKKKPYIINETIRIEVKATGGSGEYLYSFTVRLSGDELEEMPYGSCSWVDFTPESAGAFELEVRLKDKYDPGSEFQTRMIPIDILEFVPARIDYLLMPTRKHFVVSDAVAMEAIVQNTESVLIKYILKINNNVVEETGFVESKKYEFVPKCSGVYSVVLLARNAASSALYDSKKEVRIRVDEAHPIRNTKILHDRDAISSGESVTFSVSCEGGKGVLTEFYIMGGGAWRLVQSYSKKNYYTFIPYNKGIYKVLALTKSQSSAVQYEDYDIYTFKID
jgi:hypothetical protein